jgi:DNA-binding GntR family transcriptional regulator
MKSPISRKIAKPKSLTALALDKIRTGIVTGLYPLGSPLYEKVLADEFGISKTPVREALVQLQREGLVVVVPHSGTFVFELANGEVTELCELRLILEVNALRLAMHRGAGRLVADIVNITAAMRAALDKGMVERYRELDSQFHLTFFAHCGNAYLANNYGMIEAKVTTLRAHLNAPRPDEPVSSLIEHEKIARHLSAGDIEGATALLTAQIKRFRTLMRSSMEIDPAPIDIFSA